jgi:hypothetical protein
LTILAFGVTKIPIQTQLTMLTGISILAINASDVAIEQLNTTTMVRAGTRFAVIRSTCQCVTIVTRSTLFTAGTGRVVLTDTTTSGDVASIGVFVAVARNAASKRSATRRVASVARTARLTELTDITLGTCALLNVASRAATTALSSRLQLHTVNEANALWGVSGSDLESCDV